MAYNHETIGGKTNQTNATAASAAKYHSTSELSSSTNHHNNHNQPMHQQHHHQQQPQQTSDECYSSPPIVYGELSILGYNGYIPNTERNGRRNRSKFLLCKRPAPNGIKKSRHYIVKQPQATKAIQDKDLHSISYTFSRSQTIIVEYRQDENTDMFQIGRSSEDPIDFVVMDTISTTNLLDNPIQGSSNNNHQSSGRHHSNHHHNHSENSSSNQHQVAITSGSGGGGDVTGLNRFHRQLAKVGEDLLHYGPPPPAHDHRNRINYHRHQAVLLNYPQPNISNLPPMVANHFRNQDSSLYHQHAQLHYNHGHSSGSDPNHNHQQLLPLSRSNGADHGNPIASGNSNQQQQQHHESSYNSRHNIPCKRSHATQSTISRFACRILVDRTPPYTARIYAAGFDSSKNIFLGEKATKWEQDSTIDGLTTNGVLLMHPKQGNFYESSNELKQHETSHKKSISTQNSNDDINYKNNINSGDISNQAKKQICSTKDEPTENDLLEGGCPNSSGNSNSNINISEQSKGNSSTRRNDSSDDEQEHDETNDSNNNSNNNNNYSGSKILNNLNGNRKEMGGVWREVSVDGGIYAIRESRSAAQKGTRIENENNVLQDGTLIDLCGATLLWRSVDGFKASPSKKSLEEKIDLLNASRPQCPVGLNTLVIPRKPIIPTNQLYRNGKDGNNHHHHSARDNDKTSHQPYVYLKCGHVQGYHDWGATDKSNLRTCPICLSVGAVAKLSMGLEPSFYVDSGPLTYVFSPCGHMASEKTVKYWCSIKIPHGTHFFHSICPFCATPLAANEPSSARLIFQDDLD